MKKDYLYLDNLPLAAYLHLCGFRIVSLTSKPGRPDHGVFIIPREEGIEAAVSSFVAGEVQVEPRAYLSKIRTLKKLIREINGGPR